MLNCEGVKSRGFARIMLTTCLTGHVLDSVPDAVIDLVPDA